MTDLRTAAQQALEALEGGADSWQLIGPAIDALKEALVEDAMQKFTDVSQDIEAALAEPVREPAPMPPFPPASQWKRGCAVCGLGADGKAYGYVCSRSDCPTRITCGGTV